MPDGEEEWREISAEIALAYYDLHDDIRPKTQNDFEIWAWEKAIVFLRRMRKDARRFLPLGGAIDNEDGDGDELTVGPGAIWATPIVSQVTYCELMDVLRTVARLPHPYGKLLLDVIKSETVAGYAEDNNVSLFEAMKDIKHARAVMHRLWDEMADEKRDGAEAPQ